MRDEKGEVSRARDASPERDGNPDERITQKYLNTMS